MRLSKLSTLRAAARLARFAAILAFVSVPAFAAEEEQYAPRYPEDAPIDVAPSVVAGFESLQTIDFLDPQTSLDGWIARDGVALERGERALVVKMNIRDPYFFSSRLNNLRPGTVLVKIRVRRTNKGAGQIFFATPAHGYEERYSEHFKLAEDDQFHDYVVPLVSETPIQRVRFDIGNDEGVAEIERVEFLQVLFQPLKFGVATSRPDSLDVNLINGDPRADRTADLTFYGFQSGKEPETTTVDVKDKLLISRPVENSRPFKELEIVASLQSQELKISRRFFAFNESLCESAPGAPEQNEAPTLRGGKLAVRFAPDASGAEVFYEGKRVAVIFPLACEEGDGADVLVPERDYAEELQKTSGEFPVNSSDKRLTPVFRSVSNDGKEAEFALCEIPIDEARKELARNKNDQTDGARAQKLAAAVGFLKFRVDGDLLRFDYDAPRKIHAPVLCPLGEMTQAVFPGVEYLEKGEHSSSTADIKTAERVRYAPPIHHVTQPFLAIATDRGSATTLYNDPATQPVFAVPDFIDGDANRSRMNLCATSASGAIRFAAPESVENAILWAVKTRGLPELPKPLRVGKDREKIILDALTKSIIATPEGWAHALLNGEKPYSFAPSYGSDFVSAIWEITGKLPETPRLDFGGSHIPNYAAYLLEGKGQWLVDYFKRQSRDLARQIHPDGSFRYYGKFLWGSKTDYASGNCGNALYALGKNWKVTGSRDALATLLKGADFMNSLTTPRGAQVWELSLHTPDVMGASRCCMANVYAYEATGETKYLDAARRWAITGLPFVYLWEDRSLRPFPGDETPLNPPERYQPMMNYATIAVFGATGWSSPNWMGRPVQWCGLDYAQALILLAPYDKTLDWRKIADGIVTSAECQLCLREDLIGLLPDSVDVKTQERFPYYINPCVVYMLRRILDGKHTNVAIVDVDGKRVVSPFPATVDGNVVRISAREGMTYQIMIDGEELREIHSQGIDEVRF